VSQEPFALVSLDRKLKRSAFNCGAPALDRYFREQVGQDVDRHVASCFVALAAEKVAGFYTLCACEMAIDELPDSTRKKLPRYDRVPCALLGRLAVAVEYQGQKLGAALLVNAIRRCAMAEVAIFALVVEAMDREAAAFYAHHGFIACPGEVRRLFRPIRKSDRN
jgi:GNAT superfamily N-acetyltransferase